MASDEGMTQSLQRSQPFRRVNLQDLLHKIYKLVNLNLVLVGVLKRKWNEAVIFRLLSDLSLIHQMLLVLVPVQLASIVGLKQLSEIIVMVIVDWLLYFVLHVGWYHCNYELVESLEYVALLWQVETEEPISVLTCQDHLLRGTATKLQNLEKLIIVVLAWENWNLDKHFDCCAS